ncbi:hypothetical protein [Sorangium sp. So ce1182]
MPVDSAQQRTGAARIPGAPSLDCGHAIQRNVVAAALAAERHDLGFPSET